MIILSLISLIITLIEGESPTMNVCCRVYLLLLLFLPDVVYSGTIYMTPPCFGGTTSYEKMFNSNDRDGCGLPFCALRDAIVKRGHKCTVLPKKGSKLDSDSWFIALEVPYREVASFLSKYPKKRCILVMFEPPSVITRNYIASNHNHFQRVFTLFHEMVDNIKYFPLYYPQPYLYMIDDVVPFNEKKLCAMITGNHNSTHPQELYSQRVAIINFFEKNAADQFDLYGIGWNKRDRVCYKGPVPNKCPYLRNYRFAICYENMRSETYITEKIFDILHAGCVPVYWGGKKITQYIPQRCYILREDFKSDAELYQFISRMSASEYQKYLNAAKEFFKSPYANKFSISSFVSSIVEALF